MWATRRLRFRQLPGYGTPTGVPRGLFERLDSIVKRARVTPAYTEEIGALLGIIPTSPSRPLPEDLKPAIVASASFNDYKFDVNVTRLGMTAYKVQIQRSGASTWQDVAFATNNPSQVTVTPTTPGEPERVLVRADPSRQKPARRHPVRPDVRYGKSVRDQGRGLSVSEGFLRSVGNIKLVSEVRC